MKLIRTDLEAAIREAVDAFLSGKAEYFANLKHRDALARAKRSLLRVVKKSKRDF